MIFGARPCLKSCAAWCVRSLNVDEPASTSMASACVGSGLTMSASAASQANRGHAIVATRATRKPRLIVMRFTERLLNRRGIRGGSHRRAFLCDLCGKLCALCVEFLAQHPGIQLKCVREMPLARKLFFDQRSTALTHCSRPLRVAQQLDHALGHLLAVASGHDVTGFAVNYGFARTADIRHNDGSRRGYVLKNRVRKAFGG